MYFIKTYSKNYKNALQKAIYEAFQNIYHMSVEDPEKLLSQIREKITELNAENKRCTPAFISHYLQNYNDNESYKSIYILSGDWTYTITLYKVMGELGV